MTNERRGGRWSRTRPRPPDAQPTPEAFAREARRVESLLAILAAVYRAEHDVGWPPGGAGLGIQGGQSDATQAALDSPEAKASRASCRAAANAVRRARRDLQDVIARLTSDEVRPTRPSADAIISRREFDQAEHERRERGMRT